MPTDILFDINQRDVVVANQDFVFANSEQCADQNAGILSQGAGFNPAFPQFGVNVNNTLGGNANNLSNLLNIWQQQAYADNVNGGTGAIFARWVAVGNGYYELQANYGN